MNKFVLSIYSVNFPERIDLSTAGVLGTVGCSPLIGRSSLSDNLFFVSFFTTKINFNRIFFEIYLPCLTGVSISSGTFSLEDEGVIISLVCPFNNVGSTGGTLY